jgi:hypothetical protein
METLILTFRTTHAVIRAERALKKREYAVDLVPVPRGISSECGFCVRTLAAIDAAALSGIMGLAEELAFEGAWSETTIAADGRRRGKRYERIF